MTDSQIAKYWAHGNALVGNMDGKVITAIDATPTYYDSEGNITQSVTRTALKDSHTQTQMLSRINKATVAATRKDGASETISVIWERIEESGGVYTLVGNVGKYGVGIASVAESLELRVTLGVEKADHDVTVSDNIENGTVTPDKTKAKVGETVTFTVTPSDGYEIERVTVNEETIEAVDGVYSAVMVAGGLEISATFKAKAAGGGCAGCGSAISGVTGLVGVFAAIVLFAAASLSLLRAPFKKRGRM
jgi:plastocyanin